MKVDNDSTFQTIFSIAYYVGIVGDMMLLLFRSVVKVGFREC